VPILAALADTQADVRKSRVPKPATVRRSPGTWYTVREQLFVLGLAGDWIVFPGYDKLPLQ